MKTLIAIAALAALAGCATQPRYAPYAYAQPSDPSQWRVVSVTPVAPGTGERLAASGGTGGVTSTPIETTSQPAQYAPAQTVQYTSQPVYVQQPVYVAAPLYAPAPYYDYYPPVSLSLGFVFGNGGWGHRGGCCWGRSAVGIGFHHR